MKYVHEREVWWCDLGKIPVGIELYKKRPVLVLKKFSHRHFFVIPFTSAKKSDWISYDLSSIGGLRSNSFLNISQARALDISRLDRKLTIIPDPIFIAIRKKSAEALTSASGSNDQKLTSG